MKKTLLILAAALIVLCCCVSCGQKEYTVTLDDSLWNSLCEAEGLPKVEIIGSKTLTCKKGEVVNLPRVMKNGVETETSWILEKYSKIKSVQSNALTVIAGSGGKQTYRPVKDVTLYVHCYF